MKGEELRVAVCVPTSGLVKAAFAHSLAGLMSCGGALRHRRGADSLAMTLLMAETSVIHANRENLVKDAMKWNATHVMFLDDDMSFDSSVLEILLGRRLPFVACNYPKRGWPISFTAVRPDGKGAIVTDENSTGLEEANYTGFGVSLIEAQVFEKAARPWFLPMFIENIDMYTTEDNPFCQRVRDAGFKVYVDHDASKLVGHVGSHSYTWQQYKPQPEKGMMEKNQLSAVPPAKVA